MMHSVRFVKNLFMLNTKNSIILAEDMFVPSALQIIRESELGNPSNRRRKKLQK